MSIQNQILSDIVIAFGGAVTDQSNRNQLLQDWLDASLVLGLNLVTNGDFATDTDWSKGSGWTISSGVASNDGASGAIGQAILITGTTSYRIELDTSNGTYTPELVVQLGGVNVATVTSDGSHSFDVVAGAGVAAVDFFSVSLNDFTGDLDNVSVREIL